ncbi:MAG: glycosyltransferase family 4 protein [bacterium]
MDKPKVCMVSAHFPPGLSGVGDYTKLMGEALSDKLEVYYAVPNGDFDLSELTSTTAAELVNWLCCTGIENICMQYTPNLYGWKNLWPLYFVKMARMQGRKVIVVFHEVFMPHYDSIIRGFFQRIWNNHKDREMIGRCDACIVTTPDRVKICKRYAKGKVDMIPVGSNIPVAHIPDAEKQSLKIKLKGENSLIFGCFGLYHKDKNYEAVVDCAAEIKDAAFVFIGGFENKYSKEIQNRVQTAGAGERVRFLFNQPAQRVSFILQALDCFIFSDIKGPSGRKGSWMAALSHNLPVLRAQTKKQIFQCVERILQNPSILDNMREESRVLFEREYNWRVLASKLEGFFIP